MLVRPPLFTRWLLPKDVIWQVPTQEKVIYLSFDDGPTKEYNKEILNTLSQYQVKATFFCVGENVIKHPDEFNTILYSGHSVGNHTHHHLNGFRTENTVYFDNIERCNQTYPFKLFRPPYGRIKLSQAKTISKQYRIVLWSVMSWDFKQSISPERCLHNVIRYSKPGAIVVFHDHVKASKNRNYALPRFIEHYLSLGYTFKSLEP